MTEKYNKLSERSLEYFFKDPAIAIEAAEQGYTLAKRNRNSKYIAHFIQRQVNLYRERGDLKKLRELNEELRAAYTRSNYFSGLASCYMHDSFISIREGRLDDGIEQVNKGFALLQKEPSDQIAAALYTSLGYIEMLRGNIAGALKALYLGFAEGPELTENTSHAQTVWIRSSKANKESNLGICYIMMGNLEKGKQHLLNARQDFIELNNTTNYIYTLLNLGKLERLEGNNESALSYLSEALGYAKNNNAVPREIDILAEIAMCHLNLQLYEEGLIFLSEAISISKAHNFVVSEVSIAASKFFIYKNNYEGAYAELIKIIEDESIELSNREEIYQLLSDICTHLGKWKEGFKYQKAYFEIHNKIHDQKKLWAAAELEIEFENRNKKKEVELLEQHTKQQTEDLATQALQLLKHREFLNEIKQDLQSGKKASEDILKQVNAELQRNDEWVEFEVRFTQSHGQKMKVLKQRYPGLTTAELKVCALLTAELSTKAISIVLSMSPRTVEWHRAKVRKKMKVEPSEDLIAFLQSIK